ncbi:MAG: LysR family transcriptional regulator [Arenicellaceae bacterium]|nr:LysR family transcriptional regulator [Arenicellaceae bacterium]
MHQLSRIDLNLLVSLKLLLEERSVSKAAEKAFVSQPAMSKTLQRLRDLFEDELFTRTGKGLVPTPLAEDLEFPLNDVLDKVGRLVYETDFDPSSVEARISIASTESIASFYIPSLVLDLQKVAPRLSLRTRNITDDHLDELRHGELDFSIYVRETQSPEFLVHELSPIGAVCYMRRDHPLSKVDYLQEDEFFRYPQVQLYLPHITDRNVELDTYLKERGIKRNTILVTSQLMTAMEVALRSDTVFVASALLKDKPLVAARFISKALPRLPMFRNLDPRLLLIQHKRTMSSPVHNWLREQIVYMFEHPEIVSQVK